MHDSSPPAASRLQSLWLCEAIRRHEQHNPPLEDSEACRVARQQGRTDDERILLRNLALARREGLTGALQHWLAASRWLGILYSPSGQVLQHCPTSEKSMARKGLPEFEQRRWVPSDR